MSETPEVPDDEADEPEVLEDDPDNGVFWGPPGPDGVQRRWSRAWYEWRG